MTIATDSASNERPSLAADATTADGDTDGDGNGDMAPLEAVMAMTETRKCVSIELGLLWAGCYCCGCCWCVLQPRENFTVNFEENDKCEPHFLRRLSWPEVMQVAAADQLAEWANSPPVNEQRQQPTFYFDWFSSLGFFLRPNGVRCLRWAVATAGQLGSCQVRRGAWPKTPSEDKANQLLPLLHMQTLAALPLPWPLALFFSFS